MQEEEPFATEPSLDEEEDEELDDEI